MDQEYSFGKWIEKRRKSLGLSQNDLAGQMGYSIAMVRKIEDDERRPSSQAAELLSKALEIPPDQQEMFLKVARRERTVDLLSTPRVEENLPWLVSTQPRINLPFPATLFIGREIELSHLSQLLENPNCRLLTLVGPAGIGKTRLAIQVAQDQVDQFPNGVFFVSLAPLDSPGKLEEAVASAIGMQFHGAAEPRVQLLRYLQEKCMLLILDNFEHLIGGANLLAEIWQAAPKVQLLATSRERLNLQGEWLYQVEGMSYPASVDGIATEDLETYSAVQLFLQSAIRVDPRFRLTVENQEWIVQICQIMEGIPLGIELAAAWVRVLSPREITREIKSNLDFLQVSARNIPERHRSLRAAMDHSWNLLTPQEKAVLRRLTIFRGGFSRNAALKVTGARLDNIASLLDKSLIRRVGEERYDLHELVRQYAAVLLESEIQEHNQTRNLHSSFFADLLENWESEIRSHKQIQVLAEMDIEMENVRSAWIWMITHHQTENIHKALNCLWRYHTIRTQLQEAEQLFGEAASVLRALIGDEESKTAELPVVLVQLLARQGYFLLGLDRREEGRRVLDECLALYSSSSDRAILAETLGILGFVKFRLGEFEEATEISTESLNLSKAQNNHFGMMFCLVTLAYINLEQGNFEDAYAFANESLVICRDILGDPQGMAVSLTVLSLSAVRLGRFAEAKRCAEESLKIASSVNDVWGIGIILRQLGQIHLELGEIGHAMEWFRQSVSKFKEVGDNMLLEMSLIDLGSAARTFGAFAESREYFLKALRAAWEQENWDAVLNALTEIAATEMADGTPESALTLVIQCQRQLSAHNKPGGTDNNASSLKLGRWGQQQYPQLEQLQTELESQLTPQQVADIGENARSQTLESAVQALLTQIPGI